MLQPAQYSNNTGFTLVEFMVAILIMMVGLLALLQTVNIAIATNASNKKRSDAVVLADQTMGQEKNKVFSALTSVVLNPNKKIYAGLGFVNYSVIENVTKMATTTKNVQIIISWREKNVRKSHSLTTVIGNPASN